MTVLDSKDVTARKAHHCHGCHHDIPKGDVYNRQVNTDGGKINTFRLCRCCVAFIKEYDEEVMAHNKTMVSDSMKALYFWQEHEEIREGDMPAIDGYPEFARAFWAGTVDFPVQPSDLRDWRRKRGRSLRYMAEYLDVTNSYWSKVERGEREPGVVTFATAVVLLRGLGYWRTMEHLLPKEPAT